MRGSVVCDSSALVAMLVDGGPAGRWATAALADGDPVAPHLVLFEGANVLRRQERSGVISPDQAAQAHADLVDLPIDLFPYEPLAARVWQLRANLTSYDATYVALAELLDVPLITLDARIARSPGIDCDVRLP